MFYVAKTLNFPYFNFSRGEKIEKIVHFQGYFDDSIVQNCGGSFFGPINLLFANKKLWSFPLWQVFKKKKKEIIVHRGCCSRINVRITPKDNSVNYHRRGLLETLNNSEYDDWLGVLGVKEYK